MSGIGGSVLFVECCQSRPRDAKDNADAKVELTGKLGDVMKESARIASTYARTYLMKIQPQNKFFNGAHLHVHVPEVISVILALISGVLLQDFFVLVLVLFTGIGVQCETKHQARYR